MLDPETKAGQKGEQSARVAYDQQQTARIDECARIVVRTPEHVLRDRFSHHPPRPDQVQRYQVIRDDFQALAIRISKLTVPGKDQDAAIERLHEAMMLANRAIALE